MEIDRPGAPAQEIEGLARDRRRRRSAVRGPGCDCRDRDGSPAQQRHPPSGRAKRDRIVDDPEGVALAPQGGGGRPRDDHLPEVQPLEEVERPEREHQDDRDLTGTTAALEQVGSHEQERGARRQRKRVEQSHRRDRFEIEQQMSTPADVRSQRGGDIDQANQCRGRRAKARQPGGIAGSGEAHANRDSRSSSRGVRPIRARCRAAHRPAGETYGTGRRWLRCCASRRLIAQSIAWARPG